MSFVAPPNLTIHFDVFNWSNIPVVVSDDTPDSTIILAGFSGGRALGLRWFVSPDGTIRIPRALVPSFMTLVGAKQDESKAYIALNFDVMNAVVLTVTAVDETGGSSGGGDAQAHIAGTVTIDGAPASRTVVVIKDDPAGHEVVAVGQSEPDGTFDIEYDWDGAVIALAIDTYGQAFEAETALNSGVVVHPSSPNGYVYEVTTAGTTGETEPSWSTSGSVISGSVTFAPKPYYRPVASGPLQGELIEP